MGATALEGNTITSKSDLTINGEKTFEAGHPFTIQSVHFDPRAILTSTAITLEEIPGVRFDPALDVWRDYPVPMSEETIIDWVAKTSHPEGL